MNSTESRSNTATAPWTSSASKGPQWEWDTNSLNPEQNGWMPLKEFGIFAGLYFGANLNASVSGNLVLNDSDTTRGVLSLDGTGGSFGFNYGSEVVLKFRAEPGVIDPFEFDLLEPLQMPLLRDLRFADRVTWANGVVTDPDGGDPNPFQSTNVSDDLVMGNAFVDIFDDIAIASFAGSVSVTDLARLPKKKIPLPKALDSLLGVVNLNGRLVVSVNLRGRLKGNYIETTGAPLRWWGNVNNGNSPDQEYVVTLVNGQFSDNLRYDENITLSPGLGVRFQLSISVLDLWEKDLVDYPITFPALFNLPADWSDLAMSAGPATVTSPPPALAAKAEQTYLDPIGFVTVGKIKVENTGGQNLYWKATTPPGINWLTLTTPAGAEGAVNTNDGTTEVRASTNGTVNPRSTTVTITPTDVNGNSTGSGVDFEFLQYAQDPPALLVTSTRYTLDTSVDPNELIVPWDAFSDLSQPAAPGYGSDFRMTSVGNISIDPFYNILYGGYDDNDGFINYGNNPSLFPRLFSGNFADVFLDYDANTSVNPRNAYILFTGAHFVSFRVTEPAVDSPRIIKLVQGGDPRRKMQVTPTSLVTGWNGGELSFSVSDIGAPPAWTVQALEAHGGNGNTSASWLSVVQPTPFQFKVLVDQNLSESERTHEIMIKAVNDGQGVVVNDETLVQITQSGAAYPNMNVLPSSLVLGSGAGESELFVTNSSKSVLGVETLLDDQDWISIEGSESETGKFKISYDANFTGSQRAATIKVIGRDTRGLEVAQSPVIVPVTQVSAPIAESWVEFTGTSSTQGLPPAVEDGSFANPFDTVIEGLSSVFANALAIVNIKPGETVDGLLLSGDDVSGVARLDAPGGTVRIGVAPTGWTYNPTTEHYYKLTGVVSDYFEARNQAIREGGYLVAINDLPEQTWILTNIIPGIDNRPRMFIGLSDEEGEGDYRWQSGEPFGFEQWAFQQPNNNSPGGGQEDYVIFKGAGAWYDVNSIGERSGDSALLKGLIERNTDPNDSDGDGLSDSYEKILGSSVYSADTDGDGLDDASELALGTSLTNIDSDGDGLTDYFELVTFFNIFGFALDPLNPDQDGDGILDGIELTVYGTWPFLKDSDGDGVDDGDEINDGTDPTNDLDFISATTKWVDFTAAPAGNGTFGAPFQTLSAATSSVANGGIIRIVQGQTTATPTITKFVDLDAYSGSVLIGVGGGAETNPNSLLLTNAAQTLVENFGVAADRGYLRVAQSADAATSGEASNTSDVFEPVMPYTTMPDGSRVLLPREVIALRLRDEEPISEDRIWAQLPQSYNDAIELRWMPIHEDNKDGWLMIQATGSWNELSDSEGLTTVAGTDTIQTDTYAFVVETESARADELAAAVPQLYAAEDVPSLENAASVVYRIEPEQVFTTPGTLWIPIEDGVTLADIELMYHKTDETGSQWYRAGQVAGFLVTEIAPVVEAVGYQNYLRVMVQHAGTVQVVYRD